ncbi:MAG TPA: hypothetical protein VK530_03065 [Candidatus Acidoferrum sp.]|nr:hypothetical protein [Candidatus Acidoferrum sp.]
MIINADILRDPIFWKGATFGLVAAAIISAFFLWLLVRVLVPSNDEIRARHAQAIGDMRRREIAEVDAAEGRDAGVFNSKELPSYKLSYFKTKARRRW